MHKIQNKKLTQKITGFTLIELIITLFIGSLLLAWGIPNYRDFKIRKMVTDNTNDLIYTLNFARAEAIRRGQIVRVRARGAARDWERGSLTLLVNPGLPNERLAETNDVDSTIAVTQSGGFIADIDFDSLGGLNNGLSTQFRIENTNVNNAYRTIQVLPSGSIKVIRP